MKDATGQALAYIYFEDEPRRTSVAGAPGASKEEQTNVKTHTANIVAASASVKRQTFLFRPPKWGGDGSLPIHQF